MAAYPPVSGSPSSRVELHISCKDLCDKDVFSKSDPIVCVYTLQSGKDQWTEYGRTEWIKNTLNPKFSQAIEMDYRFEEVQKLKFSVFDIDNETSSLDDDDFLGFMECTLGEVVSAGTYTKPLQGGSGKKSKGKMGTITIQAEEVSERTTLVVMKFSAHGLDKKDFLGKSDPYLEFMKVTKVGSFTPVYRTDVIKNTLNPTWPEFEINSHTLCSNDPSRTIKVICYDWDSDGSHDLIGEFKTSLEQLTEAFSEGKKLQWEVINPEKQKKRRYKNSGTVTLDYIKISQSYSFLDYIMGGCQINFTVGIDFTASNGDPRQPSSLHYIDPHKPSEYTSALVAVGTVCQDYDTDKLFPALGFGAKFSGTVSHEFALNGNPQNPYCTGIPGVVQAYHTALQSVQLWGPTNFAPIINHVARFAEEAARTPGAQQYFILLMLTDGEITDMIETKRAIIHASRLPMSIIIVGVGGANFAAMNVLDADEKRLEVGREVAERDIVQFVPFRKYAQASPGALASAVLAEVPTQLTEYMKARGIVPLSVGKQ